jgi:hypothetical protein
MCIPEDYYVKPIPRKDALRIVVEKHYLHRECSALYQYGLFDKENELKGVCIFGVPASVPLVEGLFGIEERNNIIELSRLFVDESVPKNGESFLITQSISQCPIPIIVSFADSGMDHTGIIYQATNWLYTGMSEPTSFYKVKDNVKSDRHIYDKYSLSELKEKYGDKLIKVEKSPKHRYIFLNCDRRRKRELLKKLKHPILPYPKRENPVSHYEIKKEQLCLF